MPPPIAIAPARPEDALALRRMHRLSLVALAGAQYSRHQIDGLLATIDTADPALIASGRYLIGRVDGEIAVSGGFEMAHGNRMRLRGLFTHPDFARQGLGSALMARLEADARAEGAVRLELVSTLTGAALCRRMGYRDIGPAEVPLVNGATFRGVRMGKAVAAGREEMAA